MKTVLEELKLHNLSLPEAIEVYQIRPSVRLTDLELMLFRRFQCFRYFPISAECGIFCHPTACVMVPLILLLHYLAMYCLYVLLIPVSSTVSLPDESFGQFDPVISCLSLAICFTVS